MANNNDRDRIAQTARELGYSNEEFNTYYDRIMNYYRESFRIMNYYRESFSQTGIPQGFLNSSSFIPEPPPRDPSFIYFNNQSVKNTLNNNSWTIKNWPHINRMKTLLLAIQEELYLRTGMCFYSFKWDTERDLYLIHVTFKEKSLQLKVKMPFSIGYEIEELTKTPIANLIEGFYVFLIDNLQVRADQMMEAGNSEEAIIGEIISVKTSDHIAKWEKFCKENSQYQWSNYTKRRNL
jgi:hypothetical protein